jgi:hypothetical protein
MLARSRSRVPGRVRFQETYAAPPPGAPLSRTLLDPDSIGRAAASPPADAPAAGAPPPPRVAAAASSTRAPLPSEEGPLLDPSVRRLSSPPADRRRPS